MPFPMLRRQARMQGGNDQIEDGRNDSCPLLGEENAPRGHVHPQRIRDVRRLDNGVLSPKRTLVQRIRSRKNRFIQRVLVVCRVAEPSRDLTFKQEQTCKQEAVEQLTTIRSNLFAHSQSVVNLSTAICSSTGNSQDAVANIGVEVHKIREYSLVFNNQVEKSILAKIDLRISEFERILALIEERANLVLDVEYVQRKLAVEQQKGDTSRIAERKQALQAAQLECERATRLISDQLKFVRPTQSTEVLELFQEYARLTAQFFTRSANVVNAAVKSNGTPRTPPA